MSVIHNQYPPTITLPPISPAGATYTVSASTHPYSISGVSPLPTGTSGQVLTTNGINYANTMAGTSVWSNPTWTTPATSSLDVKGDAEIHGKLKVGGKDIGELMEKLESGLEKIEERLAILHHNVELEDKWKDLKALGEQYRELEKYIIEKEKMWEILNR